MRKKGPDGYAQWDEALRLPLTSAHAEFLRRGELGRKDSYLYAPLYNRLSDYVTDTFNKAAKRLDGAADGAAAVFELKRFNAVLKRLMFFYGVAFIRDEDKKRLAGSVSEAARSLADGIERKVGDNADILYEVCAIRRAVRTEER